MENLFIAASGLLKCSSNWIRSLAAFLSLLMHAQPRRCSCYKASLLHHKIKDSSKTDHVLVHINSPRVFSGFISTTSSVMFIAARISYIHFFTAVHVYMIFIIYILSTVIIHHLDGLFGPNTLISSQLAC